VAPVTSKRKKGILRQGKPLYAKDALLLFLYYTILLLCLAAFWEPWLLIPASLMSLCVTLDTALKMLAREAEEDRRQQNKKTKKELPPSA